MLTLIPQSRRTVLEALARLGTAGVRELSSALALSPSAVRQVLDAMRTDGLVSSGELRGRSGRPRKQYRLTARAIGLFQPDGQMLEVLLDHALQALDGDKPLTLEGWAG